MSNGNRRTDLRRGSIDLKQLVSDPDTMIDAEGKLSIPQGSMTAEQLAVLEKLVVAMQSTDDRTWSNLRNLVTFLAGENIVDPSAGSINILINDSQTDDKIQLGTEAKPFYNIVTNSINVLDSNSIYLAGLKLSVIDGNIVIKDEQDQTLAVLNDAVAEQNIKTAIISDSGTDSLKQQIINEIGTGPQGPAGAEGPAGPAGQDGLSINFVGRQALYQAVAESGSTSTTNSDPNRVRIENYTYNSDDDAWYDGWHYPVEGDLYISLNSELFYFDGTEWKDYGSIKGDEGPEGPQGLVGPQGPSGTSPTPESVATLLSADTSFVTDVSADLSSMGSFATDVKNELAGDAPFTESITTNLKNDVDFVNATKGDQGLDGQDGQDADNALISTTLASDNTFITSVVSSGTLTSSLTSILKADTQFQTATKGEQGDPGPQGERGIDGVIGVDGKSAFEIWKEETGASQTSTEADFIIAITGDQGPKGDKGDTGETGAAGPIGPTGPQGSAGTGITFKSAIPTQSDLPTEGNVQGDAYLVQDTDSLYIYSDSVGDFVDGGSIQGPAGPTGPAGATGDKGDKGDQGDTGDSAYQVWLTISGNEGKTEQEFIDAITGNDGAAGPKGDDGLDADNSTIATNLSTNSTFVTSVSSNNTLSSNVATALADDSTFRSNVKGDKGDQGDQGLQGPKGDQGDTGPQGDDGVPLDILVEASESSLPSSSPVGTLAIVSQDMNGVRNAIYKKTADGWDFQSQSLKGDKGDTGDDGEDGRSIYSVELVNDSQLKINFDDSTSTTLASIKGDSGADGQDGSDLTVTSITNNDNDTITILFSDNTSHTTAVLKGNTGATGPQGPKGDTGETGAAGADADSYIDDSSTSATDKLWSVNKIASELDKKADSTSIPTKISDLTNDSTFISDYTVTESDVTGHESAITITESQITADYTKYEQADSTILKDADIDVTVQAYDSEYAALKAKVNGIQAGAKDDQTAQEIVDLIDADTTAEADLKSALGLGSAAYTASTLYATATQGAKADTALQSGDNISSLNNNLNYLTEHPNISAASSVTNSGRTYIQSVTLDSNGHVTAISSATETVENTNTEYTAGAGLTLSTTEFSLTNSITASTLDDVAKTIKVSYDSNGLITSATLQSIQIAQSQVTNLVSDLSTINTNISSNDSDISGLTSRMTTAESDIDDLESDVASNDTDIASLQTRMSSAETNITSNDSDISSLQSRMTTAESDIDTVESDLSSLSTRMTTAESDIDSAESDISALQSSVSTNTSNISTNASDILVLEKRDGGLLMETSSSGVYMPDTVMLSTHTGPFRLDMADMISNSGSTDYIFYAGKSMQLQDRHFTVDTTTGNITFTGTTL